MPKSRSRKALSGNVFATLRERARKVVRANPQAAKYTAMAVAALFVVGCALTGYYYVKFSRMIDARLHGERDRVLPRVFARPLEIRRSEGLSQREVIDRLNDLGYAQRTQVSSPGEFAVNGSELSVIPRAGSHTGRRLAISFQRPAPARRTRGAQPPPTSISTRIEALSVDKQPVARVTLDAPMLTALIQARVKRRQVPLSALPSRMVQAVLAIEDRRYYSHPGIDPIRMVGALFRNTFGNRAYLEGASTITQQLARNFFLTEEMAIEQQTRQRGLRRKLLEQFMAVILDIRATKDEVLELYLNEVYLGNRGSFAIHGVAEAARLYFGKDVNNLSLGEAATIAGIIQSPGTLSPFTSAARARERRNVVLAAMADADFISPDAAERASKERFSPVARALDAEAPYFVDFVGQTLAEAFPAVTQTTEAVDVYTTLDLHLQRLAQDAVSSGIAKVDELLSRRRRGRVPQAALIAIDPRTGDILAMVGGRSYNQSQFNRAVSASRQPGSIFKPFVFLSAFERAAEDGTALTPATLVNDEPTTFDANGTPWSPSNYENEYDGEITLRRALAMSRNAATVKVAEAAGYGRVADLWRRIGAGTAPRAFPSIALGVFEATPYDIATAYTIFPNNGERRSLRPLLRIQRGGAEIVAKESPTKRIARANTTYLVTNMMRSVLSEGTGAAVRASGFSLDAAGKTGTTNDLRDAWFVGFTPELLTVVWVGLDDNQALGLSGSQAALPIWLAFMQRALAGHGDRPFDVPDSVNFVDIDRDTGATAIPGCLRVFSESFLTGSEPREICEVHRF
ncbi:MAG TPA: PBP1A family penicillin-binding protein [Vicinamibacterales bacterium]|nr:PBP1A family penicillin-binding protein [Vicinamibacterales bacterium]